MVPYLQALGCSTGSWGKKMTIAPMVYVVDDDPQFLSFLLPLCQSANLEVRAFQTGEDFLDAFNPAVHGCVLMDLRLPGISGLEVQQRLQTLRCGLPVIIISAYGNIPTAVAAIRGGAFDFLEKPVPAEHLLRRIQSALRQPAVARPPLSSQEDIGRRVATLTAGEVEVLELLSNGKTNKEIAGRLNLSRRGVEARRANIMRKMQADSLAELVAMVLTGAAGNRPVALRRDHNG